MGKGDSDKIQETINYIVAEIEEYIRSNDMERLNGNSMMASDSFRCTLPVQLLPVTVEQLDRDREVVAPVASTSSHRNCAGGSVSRQENNEPFVEIVEQPMQRRRFRYYKEIDSAGGIQGVNSTKEQKSFPKIKIGNYVGPAEITVSLVCKDTPYRVHPNVLVGKKPTEEDFAYIYVKQVQVTRDNCVIEFRDLGIFRVKPYQIREALLLREAQNIDPFGQGFSHEFDPKVDDLLAVRLCFQVKLAQEHTLDPVVSVVIYHCRNDGCLQINKVIICRSSSSKPAEPKVIFTTQSRLNPKDVEVVFYKEENGEVWEHCVREFEISGETVIVCAVPPYPRASTEYDTVVNVMLRRPSDGTCGDPKPFTYYADGDNERKRKKANKILQDLMKDNWTPPDSLQADNYSQFYQDWRNKPGPSHVNLAVPEPSHVNSAVAGSSFINQDVPQGNHANLAMPGPSSANAGVLGPNPKSDFTNTAVPGLNYVNSFSPKLTESMSPDMVPMLHISQPMSGIVDEGSFSPKENLGNNGEYLGEDLASAICYDLINLNL